MFEISVIVCEISTFEMPEWSGFESLTLKIFVEVMRYNVTEYVVGRIVYGDVLHDGEARRPKYLAIHRSYIPPS